MFRLSYDDRTLLLFCGGEKGIPWCILRACNLNTATNTDGLLSRAHNTHAECREHNNAQKDRHQNIRNTHRSGWLNGNYRGEKRMADVPETLGCCCRHLLEATL